MGGGRLSPSAKASRKDAILLIIRIVILILLVGFIFYMWAISKLSEKTLSMTIPIIITIGVFCSQFLVFKMEHSFLELSLGIQGIIDFLIGFSSIFLLALLILGIELSIGWISFHGFVWNISVSATQLAIGSLASSFYTLLGAAWWEELTFRGYLIQSSTAKRNFLLLALFSSILFGGMHHFCSGISLKIVPIYIVWGFVVALICRKTSLWFAVGLHLAWNLLIHWTFFGDINTSTVKILLLSYHYPSWINIGGFIVEPFVIIIFIGFSILTMWYYPKIRKIKSRWII